MTKISMTNATPKPPNSHETSGGGLRIDPRLLEILVCPVTKSTLEYDAAGQELISRSARLIFPIRDGIPLMIVDEARRMDD